MTAVSTTVVVCTRDRAGSCRRTLESLMAALTPDAEVLLVDQSSGTETREAVAPLLGDRFRYLTAPPLGLSAARNLGARVAQGRLLLFTDDDCVVEPAWIRAWQVAFEAEPEAGVGFGQVSCPPYDPRRGYTAGFDVREGSHGLELFDLGAGRVGMGANMAVRRRVWQQLGGFDEGLGAGAPFPAAEDSDFAYRAARAGLRILHVRSARLWHHGYREGVGASRLMRGYVQAIAAMYVKHVRCGDAVALRLLVLDLRHHVSNVVGHLWARTRPSGLGGLLFYLGGIALSCNRPLDRRQRLYQAEAASLPSSRSPLPEGEISAPREPLSGSGSEPRLSVVIPTWNRRRELERTLAALRAHEAPPFEVIVVDNASEDGTAEWVSEQHPEVRLVRLPENLGPTGARNAGVAVARGEYIVLLDSDTEPLPGTLAAIARRFDGDPRLGAVNGLQIDLRTQRPWWWWGPHGYSCEKWLEREFDTAFKIEEGASGIRRSVYQRVGGFDERFFMLVEGRDLAARVVRAGYRIRYCPEVRFLHCQESNRPQTNAVYRRSGRLYYEFRNEIWYTWRYFPVRYALLKSAANLLGTLRIAVRERALGAWLRGNLDAVRGLGWTLRHRQPLEPAGLHQVVSLQNRRWLPPLRGTEERAG